MRETSGIGLDVTIENYHLKNGIMSPKFAPLKFFSTLFTLGFGGSGGAAASQGEDDRDPAKRVQDQDEDQQEEIEEQDSGNNSEEEAEDNTDLLAMVTKRPAPPGDTRRLSSPQCGLTGDCCNFYTSCH